MKKTLFALALAAAAFTAQAQTTVVAEWDHNVVLGQKAQSDYYALGVARTTSVGTFDGYIQGVRADTEGFIDNLNGWELGYSYFFTGKMFNVSPRIAYGAMNNIALGDGVIGNARYVLGSVEVSKQLKEGFTGYVSASHMKGLNSAAITASNRVQAGVDTAITPALTVRTGLSRIHQLGTIQNGIVVMGFYSF